MAIGTVIAVYFVIWWLVLFVTLPFGVRGQHEAGPVVDGTEPGAPITPYLWQKMVATTILSVFVLALVWWGMSNPWLQEYWS
jgi:predicted secreted protein